MWKNTCTLLPTVFIMTYQKHKKRELPSTFHSSAVLLLKIPGISLLTAYMIIDFTLKCKSYSENIFHSSSLYPYQCTRCGSRQMIRYGSYGRYAVMITEDGALDTMRLKVQRLLCACGRTHALLPGDIIPFHNYNYAPFLYLLQLLPCHSDSGQKPSSLTEKLHQFRISYQLLRSFLMTYRKYEQDIISMLRITGCYTRCLSPAAGEVLGICSTFIHETAQKIYFRLFRRPMFLNRQDTAAYPLIFCSRDIH